MNRVKTGVFLVRKGSNMTFNIGKIGKIWEKKFKILKIWSMTKKGSSEIFAAKMEIFPPKTSFRNLGSAEKIFRPPQTWRHVSATVHHHNFIRSKNRFTSSR